MCISVSAVTATYGSALTAGHFWKSAKSNQKRFAPPLGASPRLGMPSLRHCSVGPPRRAIHGPARLPRHPCRGAHCAMPAFGQRGLTGRSDQDQKQSKAKQSQSGACPVSMWLHHRYREQARSHRGLWAFTTFAHDIKTCGSELARDEAGTSNITAN